ISSRQAGALRLIEMERWSTEQVLLDADQEGHKAGLPGWDVLRFLGGEIIEVWALSEGEEVTAQDPLLLAGRFERSGLFQTLFLPRQAETRWRVSVLTGEGRAELLFPE